MLALGLPERSEDPLDVAVRGVVRELELTDAVVSILDRPRQWYCGGDGIVLEPEVEARSWDGDAYVLDVRIPGHGRAGLGALTIVEAAAGAPYMVEADALPIALPVEDSITLTTRSGEIPLTFRNETGKPLDITLQLASAKLTFPEGPTRTLRLPTRSTTLRVPVEARTSGTFPLQMSVTSTDGTLTVADRTFRVRSTAFSTVGVVLMAGAGVFLAVWWGVHIRRDRRTRAATAPTT